MKNSENYDKNVNFSHFLNIFNSLIFQNRRFFFCNQYDCVVLKLNKNNRAKKATPTIFSEFLEKNMLLNFSAVLVGNSKR
jgi:hypothetical protein